MNIRFLLHHTYPFTLLAGREGKEPFITAKEHRVLLNRPSGETASPELNLPGFYQSLTDPGKRQYPIPAPSGLACEEKETQNPRSF